MNLIPNTPSPIVVFNPLLEKDLNISPLIELMSDRTYSESGPQNISKRLQIVHDLMSTHVPTKKGVVINSEEWADASLVLVEMRKAFDRMEESTPDPAIVQDSPPSQIGPEDSTIPG